jgi:hypothetical protein
MDYSLADIKAITDTDEREGYGGSGAILWIVLIFLFFLAFSGGGFGGNNGVSQTDRDVLTGTAQNAQSVYNSAFATQKEILDNRYTTQLGFTTAQAQADSCCCAVKTAIHEEGEATRALITNNVIQDLRDRLSVANTAITSQTLANDIINRLSPSPIPAYLTCSPYMSSYMAYSGLSGCGCGNV